MGSQQPLCNRCEQITIIPTQSQIVPARQIVPLPVKSHQQKTNVTLAIKKHNQSSTQDQKQFQHQQQNNNESKHYDPSEYTGRGQEQYCQGWLYEGDFVRGLREGVGRMTWPNGSFYQGRFVAGKAHGPGQFATPSGVQYIGHFVNDQMVLGKRVSADKQQIYQGGFNDHMFQGYGKLTCKGFFKNNLMDGQGWINYEDGSCYTGMFKDGKKHGKGVWHNQGERYQGEWFEGERHGEGIYVDRDGQRFRLRYDKGIQLALV